MSKPLSVIIAGESIEGTAELIKLRQRPSGWCRLDDKTYINLETGVVAKFRQPGESVWSFSARLYGPGGTEPYADASGEAAFALREVLLDSVIEGNTDYLTAGQDAAQDYLDEEEDDGSGFGR